jgi:hypothetical protein
MFISQLGDSAILMKCFPNIDKVWYVAKILCYEVVKLDVEVMSSGLGFLLSDRSWPVLVAHYCNPSYLGDRDQEIMVWSQGK